MFQIRALSFNIRGSNWREEKAQHLWANRAEYAFRFLRDHDPDLIGFQEFQDGNYEEWLREMPKYGIFLGSINGEERQPSYDYNAIAWNILKFRFINGGGFWLSETPHQYSRDWGTSWPRGATWVILEHRETKQWILVVNSHLDHISQEARIEGVKTIIRLTKDRRPEGCPVIFMADTNSNAHDHPTHKLFLEAGYVDTFNKAGNEDSEEDYTFHDFRGPGYPEIRHSRHFSMTRVDWILLQDERGVLRVDHSEILRDSYSLRGAAGELVYPSDHYGVETVLALTC